MQDWTHEQVYAKPIEDPVRRSFKQEMPPYVPPHVRQEIRAGRPHGGYLVLQLLIEDVIGEPFAAHMKRVVLDSIGMKQSTFET